MTKTIFRYIVGGSIGLLIAGATCMALAVESLPPELATWAETAAHSEWTALDSIFATVAVLSIASSIGLLFFAPWSRWVYAASTILMTIATLFGGPHVDTALDAFFSELILLLDGFILGTAFFSDVRKHFERSST